MKTSSGKATVTLPTEDQILIVREFNAPKELVYEAWTTPELVHRWWSGQRGRVTSAEIDLRVGGRWRYVMVIDCGTEWDGTEVAFHGDFKEIVPNERIVSTEVFEDVPDAAALNTLTLTETDDGSRLEILVQHENREHRDAHINSGMEGGMQESMDLLEEVARSLS